MSCRAFSRRIEHRVLQALLEHLDAPALRLDFAATERNGPLREFLESVTGKRPVPFTRVERSAFEARCPRLFDEVKLA